jgi:hypothetical protein
VANLNNIQTRSNPGAITLEMGDRQLIAGEMYEVAIGAGTPLTIEGYQFTLEFDPAVLQFETYAPGALYVNDDNFNLQAANHGVITTSWSEAHAYDFAQGETLFSLRFTALANGTLSDHIGISSEPTVAEAYNVEGEVLDVDLHFGEEDVTAPVASEFELLENRPNPFTDYTVIAFTTPVASEATVTIYDVTGQVIHEQMVAAQAGLNEVEIRGLQMKGVLYCQVSTDGFSATRKMIRME